MDLGDVLRRLRWFHAIELSQVALYKVQADAAENMADKRMFNKVSEIEQKHVENIEVTLHHLGGRTHGLSYVAPVFGNILGRLMGVSLETVLKVDCSLENRAMSDYKKFIAECDEPEVVNLLWSNYLDESLHTEWFKNRLAHDVDKFVY